MTKIGNLAALLIMFLGLLLAPTSSKSNEGEVANKLQDSEAPLPSPTTQVLDNYTLSLQLASWGKRMKNAL